MVLSAIKRTPARVKFWFIKNYMSPQVRWRAMSWRWCRAAGARGSERAGGVGIGVGPRLRT